MSASLLVELLTEELPPKALKRLSEAFADRILAGLVKAQLKTHDPRKVRVYATPRRLGVLIPDVLEKAEDRSETKKLMPVKVAFGPDGAPSSALLKRLEKEGASLAQLQRQTEGDAEYIFLERAVSGMTLSSGLQSAIDDAIAELPIPKVMNYQLADGATTVRFVRPAHGLIALHGTRTVDISALGLKAGRLAQGHRFQGARNIELAAADEYEARLENEGRVIADFDRRRAEIETLLGNCAAALDASLGAPRDYSSLLDEVTALVEFPSVYAGQFDPDFLQVPPECLTLTMRQNQKYFPLFDASGKLANRFLIVSNMRLDDPKNIVAGNERVVRPRLADARFFFETDRKRRLADRVPQLAGVVYHNKLGSQLDRIERLRKLTGFIAEKIGADAKPADRAAWLAKADLLTSMVGEFPELQGIMGRYHAAAEGEEARVANAIEQHYRPRFAGDALPADKVAMAVALADKLEALAGLFGIGQQPSGEKDPFGLRRHALGVVRILIEGKLAVSLHDLVNAAYAVFPPGMLAGTQSDLQLFIWDRLRSYLREAGYSTHEIEAVMSKHPTRIDQVPHQLAAVRAFASLPEAGSLAAANKRVANILKQAEAKGESFATASAGALKEKAEQDLFDALKKASRKASPLLQQGDYAGYLKTFAVLKSPVDAFFDSVMVMVDDPDVRRNRLALLRDLRDEMNRIADISKLAA
jgi:glycyl-tRNA synthetase beta chain